MSGSVAQDRIRLQLRTEERDACAVYLVPAWDPLGWWSGVLVVLEEGTEPLAPPENIWAAMGGKAEAASR